MVTAPTDLPEFDEPPLVEVALTVQFERLQKFRSSDAVLFWNQDAIRRSFPRIEEHPALDSILEREGLSDFRQVVRVQFSEKPEVPRYFFVNDRGTQLIQLQPDRLSHNWRKVRDGDAYPRYEAIREVFLQELRLLEQFVSDRSLGDFKPTQCEVTYVNHISGANPKSLPLPGSILRVWSQRHSQLASSEFEGAAIDARYTIRDRAGSFRGRLRVDFRPATRREDESLLYVLQLTARGAPLGAGVDGSIEFIDLGRSSLVHAFDELTTAEMHDVWRRRNVRKSGRVQ